MFSVVILSAGFSSRMMQNKALLKFSTGKYFLLQIVEQFLKHPACAEVVAVVNHDSIPIIQNLNLPNEQLVFALNEYPEKGRFYSVQTGLKALKNKDFVFVHNVDNPFISLQTIDLLMRSINDYDFAVAKYKGRGGHPVLLSDRIVQDILQETNTDHILKEYLKKYRKKEVNTHDENILVNINTPEDYHRYFG